MRQKRRRINRPPGDRRFSALSFARVGRSGFIDAPNHSHCIQPQAPDMDPDHSKQRLCRHGRARHALPRRGLVRPLVLGGSGRWGSAVRFMGCPTAKAAEIEARAVVKPGLSQRRRNAGTGQVARICSSRSPRSSSPARNARPRRSRRSSAAPGTISFTRSPSCTATGVSCMSIWRRKQGKSRPARPHEAHEHETHESHEPHEPQVKN